MKIYDDPAALRRNYESCWETNAFVPTALQTLQFTWGNKPIYLQLWVGP